MEPEDRAEFLILSENQTRKIRSSGGRGDPEKWAGCLLNIWLSLWLPWKYTNHGIRKGGRWGFRQEIKWQMSYINICACLWSHFSRVWLFVTLLTIACQSPLSMGFSRQEYWSGFPCSPPGDFPDPRTEPTSLTSPALKGGFLTTSATWEAPYKWESELSRNYASHHTVGRVLGLQRIRHNWATISFTDCKLNIQTVPKCISGQESTC